MKKYLKVFGDANGRMPSMSAVTHMTESNSVIRRRQPEPELTFRLDSDLDRLLYCAHVVGTRE